MRGVHQMEIKGYRMERWNYLILDDNLMFC